MEVSVLLHALATLPPGKVPNIHWIGGWLGLRAGLDAVARRKKSQLLAGNRTPVVHRVF
jgi:hypothetical protein